MATITSRIIDTGGARLFYEQRGTGVPTLFIPGATGDAGHWQAVADRLAGAASVITYDRRGNSRSPRPPAWSRTTMAEQADDAAALLRALGHASAVIVGSSGGAIIALELALRHPALVRGLILHEPPLAGVLPEARGAVDELRAGLAAARLESTAAALEAFLRGAAGAAFEHIPRDTRERMLGNAETFLDVELAAFLAYAPDEAAVQAIRAPIVLLLGERTEPLYAGAASWLAPRLGVEIKHCPGAHTPYFDHPGEVAELIRRFLAEVKA